MPNGLALRRSDPGGTPRRPSNVSVSVQTKLSVHQLNVLGVEKSGFKQEARADLPKEAVIYLSVSALSRLALAAADRQELQRPGPGPGKQVAGIVRHLRYL